MNISDEIRDSKVLIIDDDSVIRMVLRQVFEANGFKNIEEACNGKEGWDKTLQFLPDIVFLDIRMPVMDGFEYIKLARSNNATNKMAILAQTGLTDLEEKKNIFAAGATDYVSKPVDPSEILARSIVHLSNTHYLKELEQFSFRVKEELQSAKRLVDISLPSDIVIADIKNTTGIDIFSYFQSSSEMGGDFWGTHKINNSQIGLYIVDFSGHGVNASLNTTRLDCLIKSSPEKTSNPSVLLEWLNNNLYTLLPREQYATMFYGVIDVDNNTLCYATAACPEMIIFRNNSTNELISGQGFPLGALKQATYTNNTIYFNKGDMLMLYSDALIETPDAKGNFMDNVPERFLLNHKAGDPEKLRECFDLFIYNFMNDYGNNLTDDLTMALFCRQ